MSKPKTRAALTRFYGPVHGVPLEGAMVYCLKTTLKLKTPFRVWPGDRLYFSSAPPFLVPSVIKGDRYSQLTMDLERVR
jgi:hypothetical protein